MKRMRKRFSKVLAVMAVLSMISVFMYGCTQKTENISSAESSKTAEKSYDLGGRTVTIGHWGNLAPDENSAFYNEKLALVESIEKKYNCKLDFYTTNNWHTYTQAILITALSNEQIADVFWGGFESMVPQWVQSELIAPLDDYFDFNNTMWNQKQNDQWIYNGKHYGITNWPDALGHCILFNKRVCAEYGITAESLYQLQAEGKWNWEKLAELAQKCTKDTNNDGKTEVWGFGAYGTSPFNPEPFIYSNGACPVKVGSDFKYTYNLDDQAVMDAIDFGHKMVQEYKVCYTAAKDWGSWEGLWKLGKIAFYEAPSWVITPYREDLAEDEIGILLIPKGPKATDYVNAQSTPSGMFMQPMVKDKDAIAAIATEFEYPYEWVPNTEHYKIWQDFVFDDQSLETIKMIKGRTKSIVGEKATWFRDNVLWSDWGIKDNIPTRTFVDTNKAAAQKAFDDLWKNKLTIPETTSAASSSK